MKHRYLEVTYRKGKPIAAYLYLPRELGSNAARTEDAGQGFRIDYDHLDRPVGIEITAPAIATVERLNEIMQRLGLQPLPSQEWVPLQAA
ncbi:MAG: hypothetical protein RL685_2273 [Pseudomonadota bacterium]|jgi:hypothetical protein